MSTIGDLSETASTIGCATHLDDSDINIAISSLAPSSSLTPSISRQKLSLIWQYCRIEDGKSIPAAWVDSSGRKWWYCQPCFDRKREKKYNYSSGSSTIIDHLRKEHRIIISGRQEIRREATQTCLGDITAFMANETLAPAKKRKMTAEEDELDQATVRELCCRYTVACSLSFAHVGHPAFRNFIRCLRPAADDILSRSSDRVKKDLQ